MRHLRLVLAAVLAVGFAGVAQARSGYLSTFNGKYGTAGTKLDSCDLCHVPGGHARNVYGLDMEAQLLAGKTDAQALVAIEPLDSDGDTYSNLTEINARTFPFDPNDKPGQTVTYCADADNDGYAVCSGSCTLAAGDVCGDCNDSSAAVHPGAVEGPFGAAVCSDALDNNCNGQIDSADAGCAAPAADYDLTSFTAPAAALIRSTISLSVGYALVSGSDAGAQLRITGTIGTSVVTVTDQIIYGSGTVTVPFKVTKTGTYTWTAQIIDGDADADLATAATTVTRK